MDEGLVVNLEKVPDKVKCIILMNKICEVERYRLETEVKKIKNSAYGVEYWQHKIPIHNKNIG